MKKRILGFLLIACMVASLLPAVTAAEAQKGATVGFVKGYGTTADGKPRADTEMLKIKEGGEPLYATTTEEFFCKKEDATAENYNIKFEYPAGGTPTLYLRGAHLKTTMGYGIVPNYASNGRFDLQIIVETDSIIESQSSSILLVNGDLTITGPGKLTLTSTKAPAVFVKRQEEENAKDAYNITIKNANLDISVLETPGTNITAGQGDITIEESTLTLHSKGSKGIETRKGNLTVTNSTLDIDAASATALHCVGSIAFQNATVKAVSALQAVHAEGDFTVQNSTVFFTGSNKKTATMDILGKFTIDYSTVEIIGQACPIFSKDTVPAFTGYFRAVAGATDADAAKYSEALYETYRYFKVVPADGPEETVEETTEETTENPTGGTTGETAENPTEETAENPTEESTVVSTEESVSESTEAVTEESTTAVETSTASDEEAPKTPIVLSSHQKILLLAVAGVLVVGVAVTVTIILVKRKKKKTAE